MPHEKINGQLALAIVLSIALHALTISLVLVPAIGGMRTGVLSTSSSTVVFVSLVSKAQSVERQTEMSPYISIESKHPMTDASSALEGGVFPDRRSEQKNGPTVTFPPRNVEGGKIDDALSGKHESPRMPSVSPAPNYMDSGKLDPPPLPLHDIEPEYPASLGLQEGVVVLRLLINEQGDVDNVAVVRAFPPELFNASAIAAFGSAKFSPGRWLGMPVKSQVTVEVQFTPLNRGSDVSGRSY